ncbi:MAG: DUF4932 domain-containing protein [Treponema sp.]|nr:DUF4932 domain-containing protein [Treponema sp.]
MKQEQTSLACKTVLFLTTIIFITTCVSVDTRRNDISVFLPEAIEIQKNGIRIAVYPQIELLTVIRFFSDYRDIGFVAPFEFEYEQSINTYFADFKRHKAVHFTNKDMRGDYFRQGFSFQLPPWVALMINRYFTLDQTAFAAAPNFLQQFRSIIPEFISAMRLFYIESNFEKFFLGQTDFYTSILKQTAEVFPDWDMISVLESFYGKSLESYNIVLSPLFRPHAFGPVIMRKYGLAAYSVHGPFSVNENGFPDFGDTEFFTYIALHEFGHSFLGFLDTDNISIRKALEESEYLMEPIREKVGTGYPWWAVAAEELILRAIVIRMLADNQGSDTAELLRLEYDQGFIYIHTVYNLLQKYIDNREIYPTFDDFIPVLIRELMKIYPQHIPH